MTIEWYMARHIGVDVLHPGDQMGADRVDEGNYAIVFTGDSAAVFEGTVDELRALLLSATAELTSHTPEEGR